MADSSKSARLELRLPQKHQEVIRRAATLRGQSIADFVIAASLAEAERGAKVITLTVAEQQKLMDALLNPKPPNRALRRAMESHRTLIKDLTDDTTDGRDAVGRS
ncbi:MAG TPA: DUF1778 domain-containing protein [Caulifigura sp.]|jgi:uncharacterized protein (DUF1778 family)|nr:DUF1778 domain-containing protein [Caulifigura sp.]